GGHDVAAPLGAAGRHVGVLVPAQERRRLAQVVEQRGLAPELVECFTRVWHPSSVAGATLPRPRPPRPPVSAVRSVVSSPHDRAAGQRPRPGGTGTPAAHRPAGPPRRAPGSTPRRGRRAS